MIKKDFSLKVEEININGRLFIPDGIAPFPVVCVCHGIPSGKPPDLGDGGYPLLAERISEKGFAVLIFNFRGTGISGGNIDLMGWKKDLKAVIDYLFTLNEADRSHVALFCFSGGAAVSICVAAEDRRVSCVCACACPADFSMLVEIDTAESYVTHFRNIGAIRDTGFPPSPEKWMNDFRRVSAIDYIAGIAPRPLLLIHSRDDDRVPISHAHRLYEKAGEPKTLIELEKAGHRLRHDDRVLASFIDWYKSLL